MQLARPHISIAGHRTIRVIEPDLSLLDDIVAPRVLAAMRMASAELTRHQIRHVVIGGLAVGANGHPRVTQDVDFLVGDEARIVSSNGLVCLVPGVPIQVGDVPIDLAWAEANEAHLAAALDGAFGTAIDAPRLIYLKLASNRMRDQADVVNLLKAGIDRDPVRTYLENHAPQHVELFLRYMQHTADEQSG